MNDEFSQIRTAAEALGARIGAVPRVGVILGSGLGDWTERLRDCVGVPYAEIPGLPRSTVPGHAGRFVCGRLDGTTVIAMQGRVHYYEGYSPAEVVRPIRALALLGVRTLILTNAAGGVNPDFRAGDLMIIRDQISLVPSPLLGRNADRLGPRFPDMSQIYDGTLAARILNSAPADGVRQGVYLQVSGPQYETPAEVRAYRMLGADAVGMSTAVEAIAARHAGMSVAGISCITNPAAGLGGALSHQEVQAVAERVRPRFGALLTAAVAAARPEP